MIHKRILKSDRIRKTNGRFGFIPHRFLLDGFFSSLSHHELILYVFLVLSSDKNGVSYYGKAAICSKTHLSENDYTKALDGLIIKDLLAFDGVFFQILELPFEPVVLAYKSPEAIRALCRNIGNRGAS